MSEARERTLALLALLADRRREPDSVIAGFIAGLLETRDTYRKQRDDLATELEIAKRDIEILRRQRTEARKAAKLLAPLAAHAPMDVDEREALRLALNYR